MIQDMISQTQAGIMELVTLHKWFGKEQLVSVAVLPTDGSAADINHQETIWVNSQTMLVISYENQKYYHQCDNLISYNYHSWDNT